MTGGLLQLAAVGSQDTYLTVDPEVSFFKMSYNRHTNFAIETIPAIFNGTPEFGQRVTCTIPRNGDLVTGMFLKVELQDLNPGNHMCPHFFWTNSIGHALIEEIELEIGGTLIDKQYGAWLEIWAELTQKEEKLVGFEKMIGKMHDNNTNLTQYNECHGRAMSLMVPLSFYFCRDVRLALPLIALQYHDVKINLKINSLDKCVWIHGNHTLSELPSTAKNIGLNLMIDYVYMDTDERRMMAQNTHEYLIEQVQYVNDSIPKNLTSKNVCLSSLNHPCKELIWAIEEQSDETLPFTYAKLAIETETDANGVVTNSTVVTTNETFKNAKMVINGHDRMCEMDSMYYRYMVPFQRHTRVPGKPIYCYSFALKPEDSNPTGTINMSRVDNSQLVFEFDSAINNRNIHAFAVNYNVLKVQSGMAGLAFSN